MPTLAEMPEYTGLPDDQKAHVTALGFDKLDPVIATVQAAGKLAAFGSNPDDLIRLPKDASGDALNPLYERLGVPKDAAGYTFDATVPAEVAEKARATAAALKLTPAQATAYVNTEIAMAKASADAAAERSVAAVAAAKGHLQAAWGAEHGVKEFRASKALETFGWTADDVAKMAGDNRDAYVKIMTNMAALGDRMAEARLITGDQTGGPGSMTPEQAQAKIAQLQGDPAFRERWMNSSDPRVRQQAIEELTNLQRIVVRASMQPR